MSRIIVYFLYIIKRVSSVLNKNNEIFYSILVILAGIIGFILGQLSILSEQTHQSRVVYENQEGSEDPSFKGQIVASKTGSKYHYVWCSGSSLIKEENKIYFKDIEEAKARGYTPANNCKGLE